MLKRSTRQVKGRGARRTDKDLCPREGRDLNGHALLPRVTEDLGVLARVGDDDEVRRGLCEDFFPQLACAAAPVRVRVGGSVQSLEGGERLEGSGTHLMALSSS